MKAFPFLLMALLAGSGCGSDSSSNGNGPNSSGGGAGSAGESSGGSGGGADSGSGGISSGGMGGSSGQSAGPPAICNRYVSCSLAAMPASASAVLAAYGPDGSCWKTTPEVATACTEACGKGIEQLHPSNPEVCPLCTADTDCNGSTKACDPKKGACVACNDDKYCPGGACDTAKNVCVACVNNSHCINSSTPICDTSTNKCVWGCTSDTACTSTYQPHCDPESNGCVACLSNAHCTGPEGKVCSTVTHECGCLTDFGCDSLVCLTGSGMGTCCILAKCTTEQCGEVDNGCGGKMNCGACPTGICGQTTCIGSKCTPGTSDCPGKERCLFEPPSKSYVCSADNEGGTCLYSSDCQSSFGSPPQTYVCLGAGLGKCATWCLVNSDCSGTKTCVAVQPPIGPDQPGTCQ